MNRKFTKRTTVLMMTALCALPLAGQERGVVKMESALHESVQLRADDAEALPDSAIRYAPDGEKWFKFLFTADGNQEMYEWENNTWTYWGSDPFMWLIDESKYSREEDNRLYPTDLYWINGEETWFCIPAMGSSYYHYTFPSSSVKMEYDANGNLISFKFDNGIRSMEFTCIYNSKNNPVYMEGWYPANGNPQMKVYYEYNADGYPTLLDYYIWDGKVFISRRREKSEYDTQGKRLYLERHENNEREYRFSYEYYDEHHFSSISSDFESNDQIIKTEFKYGTAGKLEALYEYWGDELSSYTIFYPNTLDNPGNANEPLADMQIWSYAGTLHVRTAQPAVLHVYTLTGALHAQQTLPTGETALPLPPGIYIVKVGNATEKIVIGK